MTRPGSLEEVVRGGLCAGCGICESMAGRDTVEMAITEIGHVRPLVKRPLPADTAARVLSVCPGVSVQNRTPVPSAPIDPVWGPHTALYRTWAADEAVRHTAATGGTLSALGQFLLSTGEVEAILHVRASPGEPMLTEGLVSRRAEDVLSGAQSRYGPAAPLVHVNALLDEGVRFAVVAKPCDIAAIRNLERIDERVTAQVPLLLTIFCGGVLSLDASKGIAAFHGVSAEELSLFRWRGNGWPGPARVQTRDGRGFDVPYERLWASDAPWPHDLQFRCKICPDAIGELADITCADAWLVEAGERVHHEAPGVNLTVARTEAGRRLIERAAAAGAIVLAPLALEELDELHYDHLPRRLSHPARRLALVLCRQPHLRARGFRDVAMVRRAGPMRTLRAFLGTVSRVRRGKNVEPLPAPSAPLRST